jgi:hypothetical protein
VRRLLNAAEVSRPPSRPSASLQTVGVLTQMDAWSASTRYRALQHLPRLREHFKSVEVSMPGDSLTRRPGRAGQIIYFAGHAERYAARSFATPRFAAGHDAVLVQRGLYPLGPGLATRGLSRFPGRIVLDLDDALFEIRPSLASRPAPVRWLYGPQQTLVLLRRADAVVVSTPALADLLPGVHSPVTILPTVPDPARYPVVDHDDSTPVVIGWAGTIGGLGYLDPLRDVMNRLSREGTAILEVVSSRPWVPPARFHPWLASEETMLFSRFGIGIMPLPDTPYTRAKAGFKLLQYMAAGLPVVASPIGVNTDLVSSSGAGFLATTPDEWEDALRTLAADCDLRRSLGAAGRAFVEGYANLHAQGDTLAALLRGGDS